MDNIEYKEYYLLKLVFIVKVKYNFIFKVVKSFKFLGFDFTTANLIKVFINYIAVIVKFLLFKVEEQQIYFKLFKFANYLKYIAGVIR